MPLAGYIARGGAYSVTFNGEEAPEGFKVEEGKEALGSKGQAAPIGTQNAGRKRVLTTDSKGRIGRKRLMSKCPACGVKGHDLPNC